MKPKTIILMVIAIACGLGASYMTSQLIANRGDGAEAKVDKVTVLVAKKKIEQGMKLDNEKEMFETKEFVKEAVPENAVKSFVEVQGKFLKINVHPGGFLVKDDVSEQSVSLPIPPGFKAVGLRVNSETSGSGWMSKPGSRVDVLWTYRSGSDKESGTVRLLENVLVLAADQTKGQGEDGGAMPAQVVTVALKDEEVLKLTLAKDLGTMSLVLRTPGDVGSSENTRITVEMLKKGTANGKQAHVESESPDPKPAVVVQNNNPGDLPDPMANLEEYHVTVFTPEGTKRVTFLKNKLTGKWIRNAADQGSEAPNDFAPVSPQVGQPAPDGPAVTPGKEAPAPRKETSPKDNFEGF